MAPKGGNAKKESGRAKKAENEAKKQQEAVAEKERKEAAKWDAGAKEKNAKEDKEAKRLQALAAKQERERLLAAEEAEVSGGGGAKKSPVTKKAGAGTKKVNVAVAGKKEKEGKKGDLKPAGPGAIAAGGGLASVGVSMREEEAPMPIESFAASNLDDALQMMEVVNARTDKASVGQQAAGLERHPERRFKAAFAEYQERELPVLRKDHPGLRLNQYKEMLFKQFQKSPENPFNQTLVSYDATKEERVAALDKRKKEVEERLRESTEALSLK